MKNEHQQSSKVYSLLLSLVTALLIAACSSSSSEDPAVTTASNGVSSESSEDSYTTDVDDIAGAASGQSNAALGARIGSSGRTAGLRTWLDDRICESTIITVQQAVADDTDTLTIDFGTTTGCTDAKGNVRKGKIIVIYPHSTGDLPRWVVGATNVVTTDNFTINGVKVEGVRTTKNVSPNLDGDITWEVTLVGGKLTFTDGTTATRDGHHFRQWFRNGTNDNLLDDQIKILATFGTGDNNTSGATGTNHKGYSYVMTVKSDITYKATCLLAKIFVPVAGSKELVVTKNTEVVTATVDYGDGTCDKSVTITVNGKSKTETISRDSNG